MSSGNQKLAFGIEPSGGEGSRSAFMPQSGRRRRWDAASQALVGLALLAGPSISWAQCSGEFSEELTLDWNSLVPGLTAGSNYSGTATIAASQGNVTVNISMINTGVWTGSQPRPGVLPNGYLALGSNFSADAGQQLTVSLNFENTNGDPLPVENIEFTAFDIDSINAIFAFLGRYRDRLILSAGTWSTSSSNLTVSGVTVTTATAGSPNCPGLDTTDLDCRAAASTGTGAPITSFTLTYNNNPPPPSNGNPEPYQEVAITDVTFCVDPATVPVTIGSVEARQEGSDLAVEWYTTMEKANAGFNLYGNVGGAWTRLNANLIPSHLVDAEEPQHYTQLFPAIATDRILIEDLDIRGRPQRHGPFEVGRRHGAEPQGQRVDVAAIGRANDAESGGTLAPLVARAALINSAAFTAAGGATSGRLLVTQSGIQRLSHGELLAAGVDLTGVLPSLIGIADAGRAVPRYVDDANANGVFDAGDAIEFVGEVALTLYSNTNVYVLTSDGTKVVEASSKTLAGSGNVSASHSGVYRAFPDNRYSASAPLGSIPWYDVLIRASGAPTLLWRTFDLPDLDTSSITEASLEVDLWGLSDFPGTDDHHVIVQLNGVAVAKGRFDGLTLNRIQARLDPAVLRTKGNELAISLPFDTGNTFDFVGLDGFQVSYPAHARTQAGRWSGELAAGGPDLAVGGISDCDRLHLWGQLGTARPYRVVGASTSGTDLGCAVVLPSRPANAVHYWLAEAGATHSPEVRAEVPAPTRRTYLRTQYLIVTHPLFADALGDLVALQQSRGLRTQVVTTDAIYAAYSDHQRDSDAIQRFIRESAGRPGSRLKYLLIVGGDVPDYFNVRGAESLSFVPTRYAKVGDLINFAPTDVPYGDVDGDGLPDLPAGRLIVRTIEESSKRSSVS